MTELLTDEELETARDLTLEYPNTAAKLVRAYEALVLQVAELTERLELEGQKWLAAEADIATEKAAREAAILEAKDAGDARMKAESEAATLRAKLERQQAEVTASVQIALDSGNRNAELRAKLETARALFDRCERTLSDELLDDIDTWLETKP